MSRDFENSLKGKPTASLPWRLRDRSVVSNFPPAGHTLRGFLAWSKQVRIISILNLLIFFMLAIIYPLAYPTTNQSFRSGKSRRSERYESDDGLVLFSLYFEVLPSTMEEDAVSLLSALLTYQPSKRTSAR